MHKLDDSNFLLYAAANYVNTHCYDSKEFFDDLKKFKYLKRLFSRYHDKEEIKERLILNHLITLYNVFECSANTRMLFYRTEEEHWYLLKTFLVFLNYMPEMLYNIGEYKVIRSDDIPTDPKIEKILREL